MKKQLCLYHCLSWLLCLWLTGCRSESKTVTLGELATARAASTDSARPSAVDVFEVPAATEEHNQPIPAVIAVEGTAAVLAKRDGVIVELAAQPGTQVKQGDVLARFDDDDSRMQLRQAELEVARLQYEERQYEASIKINRSELERQQTLAREGLTSQTDTERAQYRLELSQQEWEKTRLATRMAQARAEAAKLEVEKTVMRAPLTGLVTQRFARLGSSVVRSEKLFEIAPLAPLEVQFQVAQSEVWQPRIGELLRLSLTGEPRIVATARLYRMAPVADAASNARSYAARLPNAFSLIPGTAVYIQRPHSGASTGWWIPRAALPADASLRQGDSAVLWLADKGQCITRTVWLGTVSNEQVEIRSGLTIGEQIILNPPPDLKSGERVAVNQL